ncbi:MAG TPA: glycosyltransferase family 2 protein [Bryobacteraceae bacterium]|jgi:glycosyltransferase involved in cell wall biosynthesis|nr:glycosyltransferase family 2 protein [Bryobacteraceae bacterium]
MSKTNPRRPRLSVVVPAYNEEETLATVICKLLREVNPYEILVVDDASTDGTASVAKRLAGEHDTVRLITHLKNQGKTQALKSAIQVSRGDIVIVQDADLEYDPSEIQEVIQPIVDGVADVVYGSRFLVRKAARVLYFNHYLANKALTFLSNVLTNVNLSDIETGYKAFRGDIIRNMIITSTGFGFEVEVTAKVTKLGCVLYEVPISYYGRTYEQGKKIGWKDAIAAFWYVFRYNCACSLKQSYQPLPSLDAVSAWKVVKA